MKMKAVNCSPSLLLCTTLSTHLHLVQLVLCVVMLKLGCQQTFLMIWSATKLLIAPHLCFCARHYLLICILFSLYHVLKIYEKLGCLHPFLMIQSATKLLLQLTPSTLSKGWLKKMKLFIGFFLLSMFMVIIYGHNAWCLEAYAEN